MRKPVIDAAVVLFALGDAWYGSLWLETDGIAAALIACAALVFRRRWPLPVFLATLPATFLTGIVVAPAVALYTLAVHTRRRWPLVACVVAEIVLATASDPPIVEDGGRADALIGLVYLTALAAAPVLFGRLVRTRDELARRLVEIEEVRDHERHLHAQAVLARERAQIGREMHDVVSHQVSLIAVRAGALMVAAPDTGIREAANTIRKLSVDTLDELRHLVTLLRAAGGRGTDLTPQPTLADLHTLIDGSAITVELEGTLPAEITGAAQRAVYRTVQEALTNVRKHAPGAGASVRLWSGADHFGVTITNTAPTRVAIPLPGAGYGLLGLSERAELLHGQLTAGATPDGGFRVELRLDRS
ncbi:sensor histidine kinase [Nocardia sp. NPDC127526]|uniref:sensor histidine kinase n=1 Tax=Nocardia sp. NPDC127526 TaxID=3345393 RepID=UPI00362FEC21